MDAHAEVQKFNKEQKLKPYNYPVLLQKYGSADDAAATGKGNGSAAAGPSKGELLLPPMVGPWLQQCRIWGVCWWSMEEVLHHGSSADTAMPAGGG